MADGNGTVTSRETADDKKTAHEIVNLDVDNPNNLDIAGAIAEAGTGYHFRQLDQQHGFPRRAGTTSSPVATS